MARTRGAKPNTSIVVKGARQKLVSMAEEFKQQGNAYFVSLEYSKAIECYTKSLKEMDDGNDSHTIENKLDLKKLVLSTRAQSYLKLRAYQKAYDDANRACLLDPEHVKSIGRRGTANYYLGNVK